MIATVGFILAATATSTLGRSHCDRHATTQMAMTACADADLARQEAKRDAAYRDLLTGAKDPITQQRIRSAEAAWEAYRDAYISAAYPLPDKQQSYGSIYPMSVAYLKISLIREHITALTRLAELHKNK